MWALRFRKNQQDGKQKIKFFKRFSILRNKELLLLFKTENNFLIVFENSFWFLSLIKVKNLLCALKQNLFNMQIWSRTFISDSFEAFKKLKNF